MAEKTLNTRILLKYDSYTNWTTNNPVLKAGEMAIATIQSGNTQEVNSVAAPQVLIKIGDGTNTYNDLPFASAKAVDVYSWAKAATKPEYQAAEIKGLDTYIAGEIQDTDTQYNIVKVSDYQYKLMSKAISASSYNTEVAVIDIPNDTAAITALQGLVGDTAVATQIANSISALDLANTYDAKGAAATAESNAKAYADGLAGNYDAKGAAKAVQGETTSTVKNVEDSIAAIKDGQTIDSFADVETALSGKQAAGDYATKAQAQSYANAKDEAIAAAKKAGDDAQADVDALAGKVGTVPSNKTVVQMISDAQTAATYDDTAVKADITALEGLVGDTAVSTQISTAVKEEEDRAKGVESGLQNRLAAVEGDYLKAADKTALQGEIDAVDGKVTTNTNAIATLNGNTSVDGSVDKKIADAINDFATKVSSDDTVNTYKELIDYAASHGAEFTELVGEVDTNTAAIATLNGDSTKAGSVDKKIADAIAAENLSQYATDVEHSALAGRVTTAEGEIDTLQSEMDAVEGRALALEQKVGDTAVSAQINAAIEALKIGDYAKAADLTASISRISTNEGDIASLETEVAKKANNADLAAIAKTGNVNDLIQSSGDILIFDCGDSNC